MARTTPTPTKTKPPTTPPPRTAPAAPARPTEPEFPLLGYLDGLMEDLRGRVPAALRQWEVNAIHQSRVATRRMKAAIDLMRVVLTNRLRRPFGKVTRNLRRRLGPLRDADVMIEHLRDLESQGKYERAIQWLSGRLCREREALRQESTKQGPPAVVLAKLGSWWAVREEIVAARDAVDTLLAESLHLQLDAFAEQADRLVVQTNKKRAKPDAPKPDTTIPEAFAAAAGRAGTGQSAGNPSDGNGNGNRAGAGGVTSIPIPLPTGHQDPHELRISGKALRYTLEMAVVQGHKLPGSVTKSFKKMQEGLGYWHDYVVLADRAMQAGLDEQLGHRDPELMDELLELVRAVLRRATHHLDKFNRLWSHDGEVLTKAIRASFPLTRPSPAPATPLPEPPGTGATGAAGAAEPLSKDSAELAAGANPVSEPRTDPGPAGSGSPAAPEGCPPADVSGA